MEKLTPKDIREMVEKGELFMHHTSSARGYISRKIGGIVGEYSGKFGEGYTVATPRFDTSQYYYVTYYIKR